MGMGYPNGYKMGYKKILGRAGQKLVLSEHTF